MSTSSRRLLSSSEHRAIAREIHDLHTQLTTDGIACNLTLNPAVTLLIGTDGGGVITIGTTARHPGWFATGAAGADLTARHGASLTTVVHNELHRRANQADADYRSDVYSHTTWPTSRGQGHQDRTENGGAACTA